MDAKSILGRLKNSTPISLSELPDSQGIYALWDHKRKIRYIGCTESDGQGFRDRIYHRHTTGSEGRSHKFSQAYCCGRMWRYCKELHDPRASREEDRTDAKLAKKLRTDFIRRYCRATYFEISKDAVAGNYLTYLLNLEAEVQAFAPDDMKQWEGKKFESVQEPSRLVDKLITEFSNVRDAAKRQNVIYQKYVRARWDEATQRTSCSRRGFSW